MANPIVKSKIFNYSILLCSFLLFLSLSWLSVRTNLYSLFLFTGILFASVGSFLLIYRISIENSANIFTLILMLGLLLRIAIAVQPQATTDMTGWIRVAGARDSLMNLYEIARMPYSPIWPMFLIFLGHLADWTSIPYYFLVRAVLIFNDVIILWLLTKLGMILRFSNREIIISQSLYFLNPLTIIITDYHPQFDSIAFSFLLSAYYITLSYKEDLTIRSPILLAVGNSIKHILLPGLIAFFIYSKGKLNKLLFPIIIGSIFILVILPFYLHDSELVTNTVFKYSSRSGYFGFWGTLQDYAPHTFQYLMMYKPLWIIIAFLSSFLFVIKVKKINKSLHEAVQISFLVFILLTPGWAIQYLFWLLPFGALLSTGRKQFILYSVFGSLSYLEYFSGDLPVNSQIFLPVVYLLSIWWLFVLMKND